MTKQTTKAQKMNVPELWREEVEKRDHYSQYDKDEFIQILNTRCPDWKQQIRDEAVWPDLHCYGTIINELLYLDVILEELGLKFAYYLVEHGDQMFVESISGADYCGKHIAAHWAEFPLMVKNEMLTYRYLPVFLDACRNDASLWNSLSAGQKKIVLDRVGSDEPRYASYVRAALIREKEKAFQKSPADARRLTEYRIEGWEIPRIIVDYKTAVATGLGDLEYMPSEKLQTLVDVAQLAHDEENLAFLENLIIDVGKRLLSARILH